MTNNWKNFRKATSMCCGYPKVSLSVYKVQRAFHWSLKQIQEFYSEQFWNISIFIPINWNKWFIRFTVILPVEWILKMFAEKFQFSISLKEGKFINKFAFKGLEIIPASQYLLDDYLQYHHQYRSYPESFKSSRVQIASRLWKFEKFPQTWVLAPCSTSSSSDRVSILFIFSMKFLHVLHSKRNADTWISLIQQISDCGANGSWARALVNLKFPKIINY